MTSQRENEILVILATFSRSQKDFIFRPNLIDYINLSKALDNYTSRCKCTSGEIEGGIGLWGGGASVFL